MPYNIGLPDIKYLGLFATEDGISYAGLIILIVLTIIFYGKVRKSSKEEVPEDKLSVNEVPLESMVNIDEEQLAVLIGAISQEMGIPVNQFKITNINSIEKVIGYPEEDEGGLIAAIVAAVSEEVNFPKDQLRITSIRETNNY